MESQLTPVEQIIAENPLIETNVSISSLIEHFEQEFAKEKRTRAKDERELESRRVTKTEIFFFDRRRKLFVQEETNHLIGELREPLAQHNSLFKDLSSLLKSLLKVS